MTFYQDGTLGSWTATTPYPFPIKSGGCAEASFGTFSTHEYIYCTAGLNISSTRTVYTGQMQNESWFTTFDGYHLGAWLPTTPYPFWA